ncbi:hypothetical protein, partial [Streptomyces sp. NPDC052015]|uniref:hypothetical protein n=1 Tax=Streptomyces sp. NPDC052015 TaxID=3154755 RepID=UPI00342E1614
MERVAVGLQGAGVASSGGSATRARPPRRAGLTVDNGQHVYLRCCTAYRWFLDRIEGASLA